MSLLAKRRQRMIWLDSITDSRQMSVSKLPETVKDREAWHAAVHGIFPGKNTGFGCHFLLQGIFPNQGSNPGLLNYRQTLYHMSH